MPDARSESHALSMKSWVQGSHASVRSQQTTIARESGSDVPGRETQTSARSRRSRAVVEPEENGSMHQSHVSSRNKQSRAVEETGWNESHRGNSSAVVSAAQSIAQGSRTSTQNRRTETPQVHSGSWQVNGASEAGSVTSRRSIAQSLRRENSGSVGSGSGAMQVRSSVSQGVQTTAPLEEIDTEILELQLRELRLERQLRVLRRNDEGDLELQLREVQLQKQLRNMKMRNRRTSAGQLTLCGTCKSPLQ